MLETSQDRAFHIAMGHSMDRPRRNDLVGIGQLLATHCDGGGLGRRSSGELWESEFALHPIFPCGDQRLPTGLGLPLRPPPHRAARRSAGLSSSQRRSLHRSCTACGLRCIPCVLSHQPPRGRFRGALFLGHRLCVARPCRAPRAPKRGWTLQPIVTWLSSPCRCGALRQSATATSSPTTSWRARAIMHTRRSSVVCVQKTTRRANEHM